MLSNKPYLIRAFYDWIVDSACTPLVVLNTYSRDCFVPRDYIENGEITLNISPDASRELSITNKHIGFQASFTGVVHLISAPIEAVMAIYAQENGQGMFFDMSAEEASTWEEGDGTTGTAATDVQVGEAGSAGVIGSGRGGSKGGGASHLRIIK